MATRPTITYLFWPVLVGYLRLVTQPTLVESPLTPEAAIEDVDGLISRPQIVVSGEGERFWSSFKNVSGAVRPRGALVPDAHVVALMREHGVTRIWTNDRDFRKFDGITVLNPFDEEYAVGFD